MSLPWSALDLMGEPHPADRPDRVNLTRAVVLGGEGGTLTLLGPGEGDGEFLIVRPIILEVDDDGYATYGGATLIPAGQDLLAALNQLSHYWQDLVGVYVAPRYEWLVRQALSSSGMTYPQWKLSLAESPLQCRYLWPACTLWPDGEARDGFWVEGNLDQVRATLGHLPFDHQVQLDEAANHPLVMLISRDGTQRYALPRIESSEEEGEWPSDAFLPVGPYDIHDVSQLCELDLPEAKGPAGGVLDALQGLRWYDHLRQQELEEAGMDALWEMAQVTWPMQVLQMPPEGGQAQPGFVVLLVQGMGLEEELWTLRGAHRERDAVRLSILLRNMYFAGNRDALITGELAGTLEYALPRVQQINAGGLGLK